MTPQHGWAWGAGDPTFLGWLAVLGYLASAGACLVAARAAGAGAEAKAEKKVWLVFCIFLVLLGINKQLDLQSLLTQVGKRLAQEQGWYERRREVQYTFIAVLAGLGLLTSVVLASWLRHSGKHLRVALGGIVVLLCFIVLRAATFHHAWSGGGESLHVNAISELAGMMLVGVPAFYFWRKHRV